MIKKIIALLRNAKHPFGYVREFCSHYQGTTLRAAVNAEYAAMLDVLNRKG